MLLNIKRYYKNRKYILYLHFTTKVILPENQPALLMFTISCFGKL